MAQIDRRPRRFGSRIFTFPMAPALLAVSLLLGCLDGRTAQGEPDGGDGPDESPNPVYVGIPDEETGTGFVPLDEGDAVAVETYGQGGNHVVFSIACSGFGRAIYPQIALENLNDGTTIETPPYVRPQPVACDVEDRCIKSQIFVMLGGLAEPADLDGLPVRVTARVSNEAGLMSEGSVEVVFHME